MNHIVNTDTSARRNPAGYDTAVTHAPEPSAKALGRAVALCIVLIGALVVAIGFSACTDAYDDGPGSDWYLSGEWQNNSYPDEEMIFYSDGSWQSLSSGSYLDFDYYCYGDWIYFTFYPAGAPSYTLDCTISMVNGGTMSITWPPGSMYGPVTIWYTRVD